MMKNWEPAELGFIALAMDKTPGVWARSFWKPLWENSPLMQYARAAHTVAVGAAALDHKALDDPVEDQAVIKALVHQAYKSC